MANAKMPNMHRADEDRQWLEHFGLRRRPFVAVPSPEHYFPAEPIESARQNLLRMVRRGEGAGLIAGPPGTGKSLLCHLLARELADQFAVVLLPGGRIDTSRVLWQAILFRLGLSFYGLNEGELQIALEAYLRAEELPPFLTQSPRAILPPRPVVLLVDEAHGLPLKILEDIRSLTNIVVGDIPRAHIILSGNMLLEDRLNSPRLEALAQRIVVRAYLQPFTKPQTEGFVRHQIALAGGDPHRIFSPDALEAVHRASGGIPRLVNQICDHGLFLAFAYGRERIDWQLVEEAWADLQQLPGPWNDSAARTNRPNIIEFGSLNETAQSSSTSGQMPSTVPFLRVASEESSVEFSALDTLDHVEKVVESLVSEEAAGSRKSFAEDTPALEVGEGGQAFPTEVVGGEHSPAPLAPQHFARTETYAEAIEINPPPEADPFAEVFDSESVVNTSHVEYICRQSHRFRGHRGEIWLYGRNNRRYAAIVGLGGIFSQGGGDAFEFPPADGGLGCSRASDRLISSGERSGEASLPWEEGHEISSTWIGVIPAGCDGQWTAVTCNTESPRLAEFVAAFHSHPFFSQELEGEMRFQSDEKDVSATNLAVFSADTLQACVSVNEPRESIPLRDGIRLQFPWCGMEKPGSESDHPDPGIGRLLRPVRRLQSVC